jgi:surfactin synthase thioesterase subunit
MHQLFCFPYAGGTASFFQPLQKELAGKIKVLPMEYAGHGVRQKETLLTQADAFLRDVYQQICELQAGSDYSLFGYSMGCLVAMELLRFLERENCKLPKQVILSAHAIGHSKLNGMQIDMTDEWVMQRTISFGGIPEKLKSNRSYWRVYIPIYRADYQLIQQMDRIPKDFQTTLPMTLLYGKDDIPLKELEEWKHIFQGRMRMQAFEGEHFFAEGQWENVAKEITEILDI